MVVEVKQWWEVSHLFTSSVFTVCPADLHTSRHQHLLKNYEVKHCHCRRRSDPEDMSRQSPISSPRNLPAVGTKRLWKDENIFPGFPQIFLYPREKGRIFQAGSCLVKPFIPAAGNAPNSGLQRTPRPDTQTDSLALGRPSLSPWLIRQVPTTAVLPASEDLT